MNKILTGSFFTNGNDTDMIYIYNILANV